MGGFFFRLPQGGIWMASRGKRYQENFKLVDRHHEYQALEAIELVQKNGQR